MYINRQHYNFKDYTQSEPNPIRCATQQITTHNLVMEFSYKQFSINQSIQTGPLQLILVIHIELSNANRIDKYRSFINNQPIPTVFRGVEDIITHKCVSIHTCALSSLTITIQWEGNLTRHLTRFLKHDGSHTANLQTPGWYQEYLESSSLAVSIRTLTHYSCMNVCIRMWCVPKFGTYTTILFF